ncbi:MAG: hypothetical protein HW390_2403 [Candidatus Brocadiaceae bacterium]|nr:hypothetical protein [Candidatus Brocadiaceae bacterium]
MKQKIRGCIIATMAVLISLIAVYAFGNVSQSLEVTRGPDLLWRCLAMWVKSIILTQTVLVVGILVLFMLRKPKDARS